MTQQEQIDCYQSRPSAPSKPARTRSVLLGEAVRFLSKAFAPTHAIEQIPAYFAAGLLPDDAAHLVSAIIGLLETGQSKATSLPADIALN